MCFLLFIIVSALKDLKVFLHDTYCFVVLFSPMAVVCMTFGCIALLAVVAIAIYKSNQQEQQLMVKSKKSMQGRYLHCYS